MVRDRALREPDVLGELGRRRRPLTQDRDDPEPDVVGERAQLLGLGDDKDVVRLVVRLGKIETVDGCRNIRQPSTVRKPYGTNVPSGPAGATSGGQPNGSLPGTPFTVSVEYEKYNVANATASLFTSSA